MTKKSHASLSQLNLPFLRCWTSFKNKRLHLVITMIHVSSFLLSQQQLRSGMSLSKEWLNQMTTRFHVSLNLLSQPVQRYGTSLKSQRLRNAIKRLRVSSNQSSLQTYNRRRKQLNLRWMDLLNQKLSHARLLLSASLN